jgi:hypothetical protein
MAASNRNDELNWREKAQQTDVQTDGRRKEGRKEGRRERRSLRGRLHVCESVYDSAYDSMHDLQLGKPVRDPILLLTPTAMICLNISAKNHNIELRETFGSK